MKWYLKALLQKTLSILPYGVNINSLLQKHLGELKKIELEDRIREIIKTYINPVLEKYGSLTDLRILEIGTGWVPVLPITFSLLGTFCKTCDVVKHLDKRLIDKVLLEIYNHLEIFTGTTGFCEKDTRRKLDQALQCSEVDDILRSLNVQYMAPVNTTCLPVESNSQDVIVSRLVLCYIPLDILPGVIKESYRVLRPGGLSIHRFGLYDEYASVDRGVTPVNFLKYPNWFWNTFVNNRIKYMNRDRYPYYLSLFEKTGFNVVDCHKTIDERSFEAIPNMKIAKEFKQYSREELATTGLTVILSKP